MGGVSQMVTKARGRMDGMDGGGHSFLARKDVFLYELYVC